MKLNSASNLQAFVNFFYCLGLSNSTADKGYKIRNIHFKMIAFRSDSLRLIVCGLEYAYFYFKGKWIADGVDVQLSYVQVYQ